MIAAVKASLLLLSLLLSLLLLVRVDLEARSRLESSSAVVCLSNKCSA